MSAKDRQAALDLECEVREKVIAWAQRTHPDALPHVRAAIDGATHARSDASGMHARPMPG